MFTVRLQVDASTQVGVRTASTSMPLTHATVPPMVDRSRRDVPVVSNVKHFHSSPNAQFADAPITRDLAPIPVLKLPFFRVGRGTWNHAVDGGTARSSSMPRRLLCSGASRRLERLVVRRA